MLYWCWSPVLKMSSKYQHVVNILQIALWKALMLLWHSRLRPYHPVFHINNLCHFIIWDHQLCVLCDWLNTADFQQDGEERSDLDLNTIGTKCYVEQLEEYNYALVYWNMLQFFITRKMKELRYYRWIFILFLLCLILEWFFKIQNRRKNICKYTLWCNGPCL